MFLAIFSLVACIPATSTWQATPTPIRIEAAGATSGVENLTILYTNDEHGWMEGEEKGSGAANLLGLWRQKEGYDPQGDFLILSGGDNWTGPAISSWFKGQSMVEVMNDMGYAASTDDHHQSDFVLLKL